MSCFWPHSGKKKKNRRACAAFLMWTSQPCNVPLFLCNNCWSALELNTDPITLDTASSLGIQQCSGSAVQSIWAGLQARWQGGGSARTWTCFRSSDTRQLAHHRVLSSERKPRTTRLQFVSLFRPTFLTWLGYCQAADRVWELQLILNYEVWSTGRRRKHNKINSPDGWRRLTWQACDW